MVALGQAGGEGHDGVLAHEADFVGVLVVDGDHEIAAAGLGFHGYACAAEVHGDLGGGINEQRTFGVGEVDTAAVEDACVVGIDDGLGRDAEGGAEEQDEGK